MYLWNLHDILFASSSLNANISGIGQTGRKQIVNWLSLNEVREIIEYFVCAELEEKQECPHNDSE